MTFTVVYDANVLYPNTLRDLLILTPPTRHQEVDPAQGPGTPAAGR
jgi:hypothetical protein